MRGSVRGYAEALEATTAWVNNSFAVSEVSVKNDRLGVMSGFVWIHLPA
jgi:hypothetical protein